MAVVPSVFAGWKGRNGIQSCNSFGNDILRKWMNSLLLMIVFIPELRGQLLGSFQFGAAKKCVFNEGKFE